MNEADQLLDLTSEIYDAALDRSLWPAVLERIANFIPATFVNLFSQGAQQHDANFYFVHGISTHQTESCNELDRKLHPTFFPAMCFFEVGAVIDQPEILTNSEVSRATMNG